MSVSTVAIISPGDMGSGMGRVLRDHGLEVITCLEGRSNLTRLRAQEAGFRIVPSLDALVQEADLVLSVLVPAMAVSIAEAVAASFRATGATPAYAECNAIAPQTTRAIERIISSTGAVVVDAGIIGAPPRSNTKSTRIYCSGPDTSALELLNERGLDVRVVGPEIGQASGLKMVYAASTKGTTALWTELLVAARALGLDEMLWQEFGMGRAEVAKAHANSIPSMPRRSRRWVGEMEEIAATFEHLGMTPHILQGAADIYRLVGGTQLGDQTSREPDPSLDVVLEALVQALTPPAESGT